MEIGGDRRSKVELDGARWSLRSYVEVGGARWN
jgi:hypothetical protein